MLNKFLSCFSVSLISAEESAVNLLGDTTHDNIVELHLNNSVPCFILRQLLTEINQPCDIFLLCSLQLSRTINFIRKGSLLWLDVLKRKTLLAPNLSYIYINFLDSGKCWIQPPECTLSASPHNITVAVKNPWNDWFDALSIWISDQEFHEQIPFKKVFLSFIGHDKLGCKIFEFIFYPVPRTIVPRTTGSLYHKTPQCVVIFVRVRLSSDKSFCSLSRKGPGMGGHWEGAPKN